jgi:hypothetical protein
VYVMVKQTAVNIDCSLGIAKDVIMK